MYDLTGFRQILAVTRGPRCPVPVGFSHPPPLSPCGSVAAPPRPVLLSLSDILSLCPPPWRLPSVLCPLPTGPGRVSWQPSWGKSTLPGSPPLWRYSRRSFYGVG